MGQPRLRSKPKAVSEPLTAIDPNGESGLYWLTEPRHRNELTDWTKLQRENEPLDVMNPYLGSEPTSAMNRQG